MATNADLNIAVRNDALTPLAPGPRLRMAHGALAVDVAPAAGGRVAQINVDGIDWLIDYDQPDKAMIAWGSYPMLPWAGRIRHGRFLFRGRYYQLPLNLGDHAIHGVGFGLPWSVVQQTATCMTLSLILPTDERWPFGGHAEQRIEVGNHRLHMTLTLTAGDLPMPAVIGWHPWFRKPDRLQFKPSRVYPRDAQGLASLPLAEPPPGPWDDCFLNHQPIVLQRHGQCLRLSSDCEHWVVYDETMHATCIEPQSGPPDAFNLTPSRHLPAGASISAWFLMEWI